LLRFIFLDKENYSDPLATGEEDPVCEPPENEEPKNEEPKSPFEDGLPDNVVNKIKASVRPVKTRRPKRSRGIPVKKSNSPPININIKCELNRAIKSVDTTSDIQNDEYSRDIVEENQDTVNKIKKRSPFHIKGSTVNEC